MPPLSAAAERELASLNAEKDRLDSALRAHENDKHRLEMQLSELKGKLHERRTLEDSIKKARKEIHIATNTINELDVKISALDPIIEQLDRDFEVADRELSAKIAQAQHAAQELNLSIDQLNGFNKVIDRYLREKRDSRLADCAAKIEELQSQATKLKQDLANAEEKVDAIQKEISESNVTLVNLRDNIRARDLVKRIANTQAEIDACDVEYAANAKRLYDEQYPPGKAQQRVDPAHRIGGRGRTREADQLTVTADVAELWLPALSQVLTLSWVATLDCRPRAVGSTTKSAALVPVNSLPDNFFHLPATSCWIST